MNYAKKKQEEEEIQHARAKIEEWREQQWRNYDKYQKLRGKYPRINRTQGNSVGS